MSYKDGGDRSGDGLAAGGDDDDDGDDAAAAGVRARGQCVCVHWLELWNPKNVHAAVA